MSSRKTSSPPDPMSSNVLVRLGIEDLDLILKERRLHWYGHVERFNGAVKTAFDLQVDGRPKMTWKQLTEWDCREWKLSASIPHARHTWRSGVRHTWRSGVQQASYLEGGPLMWMLPLYLHVNQKSVDDDDEDDDFYSRLLILIKIVKNILLQLKI